MAAWWDDEPMDEQERADRRFFRYVFLLAVLTGIVAFLAVT